MEQNRQQQTKGQTQQGHQQKQGDVIPFPGRNPLGLPSIQEWGMIKEMSSAAVRTGFLPKGVNPEGAAIIALKARELGLPLMVGFAHIYVVNGKPSMSAELIQAQARKNLPGLIFNILETNNEKCIVEGQRPERGSKAIKLTFTIDDARKANLLGKDVWKQYPAAMLRSRAITALLRILCPDALMGISYTPEELGAQVNEEGGVIETTSRLVETDTSLQESVQEAPITPTKSPEEIEFENKMKAEFQKIALLMSELQISKEDLRAEMHREYGVDDARKLNLDQLKSVVIMLEKEQEARKQTKSGEEKQEEQPVLDPWLAETPSGNIGGS